MHIGYMFKDGKNLPKEYLDLKKKLRVCIVDFLRKAQANNMPAQEAQEILVNCLMNTVKASFCAVNQTGSVNKEQFEKNVDDLLTIMRNDMLNVYADHNGGENGEVHP